MTHSRYILVGNYGVQNVGDEALKEYFLSSFPGIEWKVVSAKPQMGELPRLPGGMRSFFSLRWIRTFVAIVRSKGIVYGGGSLFTDTESVYACYLWGSYALVAWLFRKPVILVFQGIGPCKTARAERIARWVAQKAVHVSVRDEASYKRVQAWLPHRQVIQGFDPVWSMVQQCDVTLSSTKGRHQQHVLLLIPRHNSDKAFLEAGVEAVAAEPWDKVCIVRMQPDNLEEDHVCQFLQLGLLYETEVISVHSLNELVEHIAHASMVVSQRYHGALVALALEIPVNIVSQREGDKLDELKNMQSTKEELDALVDTVHRNVSNYLHI